MAKKKTGVSRSEEVRQLLKANPKITAKEAIAALAEKKIEISDNLFYMVKGKMQGRKSRKKRAKKMVAKVVESTGTSSADAVTTILKVKAWANEVGGLKNLKALVEALGE